MRGRTSPVLQSSKRCSLGWVGHCKDVAVEKLTISFRYVSKVFQSPRGFDVNHRRSIFLVQRYPI